MLFDFFYEIFKILNKIKFKKFSFFNISCFLHVFDQFFSFENQFFLISFRILCYFLFNITKTNIEKFPFTYLLNGRWFLKIVDRDSGNLYPIYPLFLCSDFCILNVEVVGGGGHVLLVFYATRNKFWE